MITVHDPTDQIIDRRAQVVGLCQDGLGRHLIACHFFYDVGELQRMGAAQFGTGGLDELFLDETLRFVEARHTVASCSVLCCDEASFPRRKGRVQSFRPDTNVYYCTKSFCKIGVDYTVESRCI